MFDRKLLLQHIGNIPKDITEQAKTKEPKYHYDFTQGTHKNMLEKNVSNDTQIYTTYHDALKKIHNDAPKIIEGIPSSYFKRADYYSQPFHVVEVSGKRLIKMPKAVDISKVGPGPLKQKPDPDAGPQPFTHEKYDKIRAEFE